MVQGIDVAAVHVAEDLYGICSTLIIGQLLLHFQNVRVALIRYCVQT